MDDGSAEAEWVYAEPARAVSMGEVPTYVVVSVPPKRRRQGRWAEWVAWCIIGGLVLMWLGSLV